MLETEVLPMRKHCTCNIILRIKLGNFDAAENVVRKVILILCRQDKKITYKLCEVPHDDCSNWYPVTSRVFLRYQLSWLLQTIYLCHEHHLC